jgi:peptidoglycan/LPS O-acetylase OafA/YrhL
VGLTVPWFAEMPACFISRATAMIAKYSYGIYICHLFCMWLALVVLHALPVPVRLLAFAVATASLSVALYHGIEAPLIRFGVKLAETRPAQVLAQASAD